MQKKIMMLHLLKENNCDSNLVFNIFDITYTIYKIGFSYFEKKMQIDSLVHNLFKLYRLSVQV